MSGDPAFSTASEHLDRCTRIMKQPNLILRLCMILVEKIIGRAWYTHRQRRQDFFLEYQTFLEELLDILAESTHLWDLVLGKPDVG